MKLIDKNKIQRFSLGVRLRELRELKNKEKVKAAISESVHGRLRECKNTEFVWELKRGVGFQTRRP